MFSVGILYSIQEFLELVKDTPSIDLKFPNIFQTFSVASPSIILEVAQKCEWVLLNQNGILEITDKGQLIIQAKHEDKALRIQLGQMLETYLPSWMPVLAYGRSEALKYLKPDIKQCFEEAGLADGETNEIVNWWDTYSKLGRNTKRDNNIEVGRKGEKLSLDLEQERTKRKPIWQALESNFAGFDILSVIDEFDLRPLKIEVKTSNSTPLTAAMYITKNEWNVATTSPYYAFHVWALQPKPDVRILNINDVIQHIPINMGCGEWEKTIIPYTSFWSENENKS